MPPGRKIRNHAQGRKAIQIRGILDLEMGADDFNTEIVPHLFFNLLHSIQHQSGGSLTDGMRVKIQSFLVQLFQERHKLFQIHGVAPLFTRVRIGRNHGSGMQLQRAIHEKLQGMDLHVLRVVFPLEALELL